MACPCRTQLVLALLGLIVALPSHPAAAAELSFTILDRQDWFGSSGSMCENFGAPPEEMLCLETTDHRLLGQRLFVDFGQPVALSAFANLTPPQEANERETLYFFSDRERSLDEALAEITVSEVNDAGLHAEFPAIVARYVLWRAEAIYEHRREGTTFWSTVTSSPNGHTDGLRFYGEPVAVPEPAGWLLLLVGIGVVGAGRFAAGHCDLSSRSVGKDGGGCQPG